MEQSLKDKTILITGASRGIGAATAKLLSEMGARLIMNYYQNKDAALKLAASLSGEGHIMLQADFSKPEHIEKFTNQVLSKTDRIDILINNAGIYIEKTFDELDFDQWKKIWQQTIDINLTSIAHLSFIMAKHMKEVGGGKIINISSRGAFRGEPNALAYGASKAGLNSLGQSMAKALAASNIFVYTIAPGFVETDMAKQALEQALGDSIRNQSPLGRVAEPIEIAETIAFLATGRNEYLTGSIIDINGASYLRM